MEERIIDLRYADLNVLTYPDGQPHVRIDQSKLQTRGQRARLILRIRNPYELFVMAAAVNALRHEGFGDIEIAIPYLMGARSDRRQVGGHSVDLEVVCKILHACEFYKVTVFDPHNLKNLQKFYHYKVYVASPKYLVQAVKHPSPLLIVPDKGASKRLCDVCNWHTGIVDYLECDKDRDPENGRIKLTVKRPQDARGRNCLIVDDICDGGATFLEIANQLRPYDPETITLVVSHAIFSKGLSPFIGRIDRIITSDSFADRMEVTTVGNAFPADPGSTHFGVELKIHPLPENWYEDAH
jgi:ribose-phosphate pyrophosphokinase